MPVSILIPVFNPHMGRFAKALGSIHAQRFPLNWIDVSICLDGLPERQTHIIENIVERSELRNVTLSKHNINQGLAHARNTAAKNARGDWLLLLDHDDYLEPDAIKTCCELVDEDTDLVFSNYRKRNEWGKIVFESNNQFYYDMMNKYNDSWQNPIYHSTFIIQCQLYRKTSFEKTGGFDVSIGLGEEVDFHHRLYNGRNFRFTRNILYNYVNRPNSIYNTQYNELVKSIEQIMLKRAQLIGINANRCYRKGKVAPYGVTHYIFLGQDGREIGIDYIDYKLMKILR